MKKLFAVAALSFAVMSVSSQTLSDGITIFDTRSVNDTPGFISRSIRADFKERSTIGVPGQRLYSTNITIAPRNNTGGGLHHQLNLNDGGIYYRSGIVGDTTWGVWNKMVMMDHLNNVSLQYGDSKDSPMGDYGNRLYFGHPSDNNDRMFIARYNIRSDVSELRVNVGDDTNDKFVVGRQRYGQAHFTKMLVVHTEGKVGIMTENPTATLDVNGTIRSKEVKIEATGWSDFVFDEDYKLPSLSEVEKHIKTNKHLPDIPSEKQVTEEGVNVVEMQAKLLQKIEELTLYVIEQDKKIEKQNKEIQELKNKLKE